MALNDELYTRLVSLYHDLNDKQIHALNARIILLMTDEIDQNALKKIFIRLESEINDKKK